MAKRYRALSRDHREQYPKFASKHISEFVIEHYYDPDGSGVVLVWVKHTPAEIAEELNRPDSQAIWSDDRKHSLGAELPSIYSTVSESKYRSLYCRRSVYDELYLLMRNLPFVEYAKFASQMR